eukprot:CAMPEP_0113503334 /NCGR_PEP_ID=MMETSP0014_2-20120614/34086_1 /TAXON_ID=2857 /ORGANISM="Nitzschia sp." /LENGTH=34 /DNA_ID=CAMNT_0000398289 /DNA_START=218 /DNA_END=318 /DNA_ORIENTATION=- /assembly_acc=CAM_ASM_000159
MTKKKKAIVAPPTTSSSSIPVGRRGKRDKDGQFV